METAFCGQAKRDDYNASQPRNIDVDINIEVSHADDELNIALRFAVESVDFSLGTELKGIWTSARDEFMLNPDSLWLLIAEVVVPRVFPYARASISTTMARIEFEIPPLPAALSDQIGTVDAEAILNGAPSLTLRKKN